METEELMTRWPTLLTLAGTMVHVEKLTDVRFEENIKKNYDSEGGKWFNFFRHSNNKTIFPVIEQINAATTRTGSQKPVFPGLVLLVLKWFKEDPDHLFIKVNDTASSHDSAVVDRLPKTPCMVFCGESVLTAERFMVALDKKIIVELNNFVSTLAMYFGVTFMTNCEYAKELPCTNDFFIRVFANLQPDNICSSQGGKRKKTVKDKVCGILAKFGYWITIGHCS